MKIDRSLAPALIILLLSSCGGGGGSGENTNNPNQIVVNSVTSSSSSSSLSSSSSSSESSASSEITSNNQSFTLEEDNVLTEKINFNYDFVRVSGEAEGVASVIHTRNGGVVQIFSNDLTLPRFFFSYKPAEDFNGSDDCDIYLIRDGVVGKSVKQKIKLTFHVKAVADENFKFDITNKKVFVSGDVVQLSLPYQADTHVSAPANLNFKLLLDDVPVNYSVNADGFTFVMPSHHLAGAKTLSVQFDYEGKHANLTRPLLSKIDYGDVEYWMGDKGRPGAIYVVMTEQRVDRQKYIDWINAQFTNFLNTPLVAEHSNYWNLVVIKKPAPENYAYLTNEDVSPIIFADLKESGDAFIKSFVPNYDRVILNTNLEGRATGGFNIVVNFPAINIIMHELGHTHAKLGDEYADTSVARDPIYMEGLYANISNFNDYESIPWKHWIVDKKNIPGVNVDAKPMSVGAFLGANYKANQFYRPIFSSIMGIDLFAPMGPIYSEAWVLATYERLGILNSGFHTKSANVRAINLTKEWNKNITRIDWFLNDVKQEAWTNQSTVSVDESKIVTNSYTVTAEITDLSGYLKDPHAYSAFKWFNHPEISYESLGRIDSLESLKNVPNENFQKKWTFDKSSTAANIKLQKQNTQSDAQALVNNSDWVSHSVVIKNNVHQLVSSSRYDLQDTLFPVTAHSELRADVVDALGRHLYSIGIDNPYRYYHDATGLVTLKDSGNYKIKHPHVDGRYQITIVDMRNGQRVATLDFAQ